ncbi:MAG: hypothetical protein ACPGJF_05690 [Sinimarinibacterium flocculans]|uniref:hypothetical protein n=1 Tax=Sinimarinibacterium flocculans TaxID=985250 RepID=UPI003C35505D
MAKRNSKAAAKQDFDAEAMWLQFASQPAHFSQEEMREMERHAQEAERAHGVTRRCALASLTRSAQQLIDGIKDDRETAEATAAVSSAIGNMLQHLGAVCDVLTTARTRLDMALCIREDMQEIVEKVERKAIGGAA